MKKLFCPHCSKDLKCDMGYPHDCTDCGWKQPNDDSFSVTITRENTGGPEGFLIFWVKVRNPKGELFNSEADLVWYATDNDAMNVATIWADFLGCEVTAG